MRELGTSGVGVTPLVMGCWAIGGGYTWGPQDEQDSINTVHAALANGIHAFDTAEFYSKGYSEEVLGKALRGRRQNAVIATKIWTENLPADRVPGAVEGCLRRLQTDYIDILQIHWLDANVPVQETLEAMEKLKVAGKVRAIGVCNHGVKQLEEAVQTTTLCSNQLAYSLLFRAVEFAIIPKCVELGTGVLAYSPLAQGLLTGKYRSAADVDDERARIRFYSNDRPGTVHEEPGYEEEVFSALERIRQISRDSGHSMAQIALAWVLGQPGVSAVLVGARKPEQIAHNAQAVEVSLSGKISDGLSEATNALKEAMGPNADLWRTASRIE